MLNPEFNHCPFVTELKKTTTRLEKSKSALWKEHIGARTPNSLIVENKGLKLLSLHSWLLLRTVETFCSEQVGQEIRLAGRDVCFCRELFPRLNPWYEAAGVLNLRWKMGIKSTAPGKTSLSPGLTVRPSSH